MPYRLRSDGVDDVVQIASAIIIASLGTQAWTFRYKGEIQTVTGTTALAGTSSSSTVAGPAVSTTGQMIIRSSANITIATSPAGFIIFGENHKYECDHAADGAISWKRDDVEIGTGSYTGTQAWTNINQFFRAASATTARLPADTDYIEFVGTVNANKWDAGLSDGTETVLPTTNGLNQGTLVNFTVPDCWVFYSIGSSFTGTIGKTSLTTTTQQLLLSLGYSTSTGKSTLALNPDQLSVSIGTVLGVGKQSLVLSTKPEATQLGYVNVLSKQGYNLLTKQLDIVVGNNTPFTGTLNKTTYGLSSKQLAVNAGLNLDVVKDSFNLSPKTLSNTLGWNSGFDKQSLNLTGKQESTELGYVIDINELNLAISGKPFNIQTGTSVSFVGELGKSDLTLAGKPLSVSAGTSIPFIGLLGKTSLSLSGKALSRLHGQILDIQKQSISLVTKQLSIGEVVYPIIPVERLFTFTDKGRTYLFKQTTNIYLISNRNNTFVLKGK